MTNQKSCHYWRWITGLSTAFYLQKEMIEKGLSLDIQLMEASNAAI